MVIVSTGSFLGRFTTTAACTCNAGIDSEQVLVLMGQVRSVVWFEEVNLNSVVSKGGFCCC